MIHCDDNLTVLCAMPAESVDLVYLDPPFATGRDYTMRQGRETIIAFEDTWSWTEESDRLLATLLQHYPVSLLLRAIRHSVSSRLMAYLVFMVSRLVELPRVMRKTASLYLHCDTIASHYLKVMLDSILGEANFRNEIAWERNLTISPRTNRFRRAHDVLLYYTKSGTYTFNRPYKPLKESTIKAYKQSDERGKYYLVPLLVTGTSKGECGRPWHGFDPNSRGEEGMQWITGHETLDRYDEEGRIVWSKTGVPRLKYYLDESGGVQLTDIWTDVGRIHSSSRESVGYPTQKPEALLERIILASSNEGDTVLDPFCGSGTTLVVAQKLGRRCVGIDSSPLAVHITESRLAA